MNLIGDIKFIDSIQDFGTSPELDGAMDVVTQTINGKTFVYVSGYYDHGIQVLQLANDGKLTPIMAVADSTALGLYNVGTLSTVQVGNEFFLIASGAGDDALTTFRIDDDGAGTDGHLVAVETYKNFPATGEPTDGAGLLDHSFYHVNTEVNGTQYVIAAAYNSDALSVYRVEANGRLTRTDFALDSDIDDYRLNGIEGMAVHQVGGKTYIFTGSSVDRGISVFQLTNAGNLVNVYNGDHGGTGSYFDSNEVQIIDADGKTYAIFVNHSTDRIQTYQVTNAGQLVFVSETPQYVNGSYSDMYFLESFSIDGVPFLLVAASDQDTILVMSLDANGDMQIVQSIRDVIELNEVRDMSVRQMGDRTFVLATSFEGDRISVFEIGADNDALVGTAEADRIVGMLGDDDLIGRQGNDELIGGKGDDVLSGRIGNDRLDGGDGEDVLVGGIGNDMLEGGDGADILKGGAGKDTILYASSDAAVTINLQAGTVTGGHGTGDIFVQIENATGSRHNDTIDGDGAKNKLAGLGGNDDIRGAGGNDNLSGGNGRDHLRGDAGRDVLIGGAGKDWLEGGSGNDKLKGGTGNDRIDGGTGNDKLTGNGGADVFVFAANPGSDEITDFTVGTDVIDLKAIASITNMAELNAAAFTTGGNTLIFIDGGPDSITLIGVVESDLSASDFLFS